jgi:hypothetical protein
MSETNDLNGPGAFTVSELPTLFGTLSLQGRVLIWRGRCDRCRAYHTHGWASSSPERQHRVGHRRNAGGPEYYIALQGDHSEVLAQYARQLQNSRVFDGTQGRRG